MKKNKILTICISSLLVLSLATNVYSLIKLSNATSELEENKKLLSKNENSISDLSKLNDEASKNLEDLQKQYDELTLTQDAGMIEKTPESTLGNTGSTAGMDKEFLKGLIEDGIIDEKGNVSSKATQEEKQALKDLGYVFDGDTSTSEEEPVVTSVTTKTPEVTKKPVVTKEPVVTKAPETTTVNEGTSKGFTPEEQAIIDAAGAAVGATEDGGKTVTLAPLTPEQIAEAEKWGNGGYH